MPTWPAHATLAITETPLQKGVLHPGYNLSREEPFRLDNDVAILFLKAPIAGVPLQRLAPAGSEVRRLACCY